MIVLLKLLALALIAAASFCFLKKKAKDIADSRK